MNEFLNCIKFFNGTGFHATSYKVQDSWACKRMKRNKANTKKRISTTYDGDAACRLRSEGLEDLSAKSNLEDGQLRGKCWSFELLLSREPLRRIQDNDNLNQKRAAVQLIGFTLLLNAAEEDAAYVPAPPRMTSCQFLKSFMCPKAENYFSATTKKTFTFTTCFATRSVCTADQCARLICCLDA